MPATLPPKPGVRPKIFQWWQASQTGADIPPLQLTPEESAGLSEEERAVLTGTAFPGANPAAAVLPYPGQNRNAAVQKVGTGGLGGAAPSVVGGVTAGAVGGAGLPPKPGPKTEQVTEGEGGAPAGGGAPLPPTSEPVKPEEDSGYEWTPSGGAVPRKVSKKDMLVLKSLPSSNTPGESQWDQSVRLGQIRLVQTGGAAPVAPPALDPSKFQKWLTTAITSTDVARQVAQYAKAHPEDPFVADQKAAVAFLSVPGQKAQELVKLRDAAYGVVAKVVGAALSGDAEKDKVAVAWAWQNLTPAKIDEWLNSNPANSETDYKAMRDYWGATHPGESWEALSPVAPGSRVEKFSGKLALITPPGGAGGGGAGGGGATTGVPDYDTYMTGLDFFRTMPKTKEEATAWVERELSLPPGVDIDDKGGFIDSATGKAVTGKALEAVNKYRQVLQTYALRFEAAYKLAGLAKETHLVQQPDGSYLLYDENYELVLGPDGKPRVIGTSRKEPTQYGTVQNADGSTSIINLDTKEVVFTSKGKADIRIIEDPKTGALTGIDMATGFNVWTREGTREARAVTTTPEQVSAYVEGLRAFGQVPTTEEEAVAWLRQPLLAPPGLQQKADGTWVDEAGEAPLGATLASLQTYQFYANTYTANRERADALITSARELRNTQAKVDAAQAALDAALATPNKIEAVEMAYLLDKANLDLVNVRRQAELVSMTVQLTNDPSMLVRLNASGQLDYLRQITGMKLTVPQPVSREELLRRLPALAGWASMTPNQQRDAINMLSAQTGWLPEDIGQVLGDLIQAPGRSTGVVSSTVVRRG